ncbi:MAG: hypothetical protein QOJ04_633 [Caballeronia sp.]|jgi:hypothetical protein|nr:hypothetical protein [Caballeronia sp.]MEA3116184.1 hypothetical protein [Caballeronia sp.]
MRCYLYSTGTDGRIISCTVTRDFAQRGIGHDWAQRLQESLCEPLLHRRDPSNVPQFLLPANLFAHPFEPVAV